MADAPIGISFMPSADAAANGPRQAQIEGGGSDLAAAFKILSLHLPRVLGAAALSSKRLLTSPGASGVSAPGAPDGGFNPYSAVFQSLLQAMGGGQDPLSSGGDGGGMPASLASLFGGSIPAAYSVPSYGGASSYSSDDSGGNATPPLTGPPPPKISYGVDPNAYDPTAAAPYVAPQTQATSTESLDTFGEGRQDTQYI